MITKYHQGYGSYRAEHGPAASQPLSTAEFTTFQHHDVITESVSHLTQLWLSPWYTTVPNGSGTKHDYLASRFRVASYQAVRDLPSITTASTTSGTQSVWKVKLCTCEAIANLPGANRLLLEFNGVNEEVERSKNGGSMRQAYPRQHTLFGGLADGIVLEYGSLVSPRHVFQGKDFIYASLSVATS